MTEYISREAVINDIGELFTLCNETLPNAEGHHFIVESELQTHLDFVKSIPAADAIEELSKLANTIPHVCECCVGCELEKKNGGCDNSFILSPERAKEYLSKPRWIPVTERLPEEWETVLVCFKSQGGLAQAVSERMGNNWSGLCGLKALWWMPLPEPPKEEA